MPAELDESFDFLGGAGSERRAAGSVMAAKLPPAPRREDFPFLIAEHAFDARSLDSGDSSRDPQAICLSFEAGELVYVHFIHSSGWGDVTRVRSAERGWIPIDYFAGFSDVRAIPLLAAIAAFLAQPRSQRLFVTAVPSQQRMYTFNEAAINEIISGTKLLLAKTNTLSRDAPLVQQFTSIAAARKSLLTELAHLVHVAKNNKHSTDERVIDKLVRGCYRLLERTSSLLSALDDLPPDVSVDTSREEAPSSARSTRSARSTQSTRSGQSAATRMSSGSSKSISSMASTRSTATSDADSHSLYRMNSFSDYAEPPAPQDRLREVATALIGYLDEFSGPNEQLLADPENPQTSPTILSLTRHCMLACRELLVVLDLVANDVIIAETRDELLEEIRRLVSSARSVVATLPPSPASLRAVAAQNMAATAAKCRELALDAVRPAMKYLLSHSELELPSERSYPILTVDRALFSTSSTVTRSHSHSPIDGLSAPVSPTGPIGPADGPAGPIGPADGPEGGSASSASDSLGSASPVVIHNDPSTGGSEVWGTPAVGTLSPQVSPKSELSPARLRSTPKAARNGTGSTLNDMETFIKNTAPPSRPSSRSENRSVSHPITQNTSQSVSRTNSEDAGGDTSVDTAVDAVSGSGAANFSFNTSTESAIRVDSIGAPLEDPEDTLVMRNGRVRGGSLRALVGWLTGDHYRELEFELRTFLMSFRLFTSPRDVVIELGSLEPSAGVRHFAQRWIESFWEPSDQVLTSLAPMVPPQCVDSRRKLLDTGKDTQVIDLPLQPESAIAAFLATSSSSSANPANPAQRSTSNSSTSSLSSYMRRNPSLGTQFGTQSALNLAASFRELGLATRRASRQSSASIIEDSTRFGRNPSGSAASLANNVANDNGDGTRGDGGSNSTASGYVVPTESIEFLISKSAGELASQITLMWYELFHNMRPAELLDQRFSSAKRALGLSPNVTQLVLSSNHLTAFVGDTVLSPNLTTKQRARVLKYWIRVADELFTTGNLNGMVTIVLTLQSTRIVRLSRAWESLSNKSHAMLAKLQPFTSHERNFSEYRKELRSRLGRPCVPYIGMLLSDLTLIDEGNPKVLKPSGAINFDRYLKMASAISAIQPFQLMQFDLTPDANMQAWIRGHMAKSYSQDARDSEDQWRRSLLIQPD